MPEDKKDFSEDEIRKTLWINTFHGILQTGGHEKAKECADNAVKGYDAYFKENPTGKETE